MTINVLTSNGTGNNVGSVQLSTVSRTATTPIAVAPVQIGSASIAPITSPGDGSAGSTTNTTSNTFVIGTSTYTYMRPKAITFTVQGLKPNTEYFPFFNNVYVGYREDELGNIVGYCSTVDGVQSSRIFTNARGEVTGVFYLPSNLFPCGSHTFKLVDHYTQETKTENGKNLIVYVASPLYGYVEATYEASGILKQQQTQITSTSTVDLVTLQPVNITLTTIFAAATPAGLTAPSPTVCERWFFEYRVTSVSTKTFSVTTMTSVAPSAPSPNVGTSGGVNVASVNYLKTTIEGNGLYTHTYSYRFTTVTTYHQDWVGRTTDLVDGRPPINLVDTSNPWRPSGINDTDLVEILGTGNKWVRQGVVACPASLNVAVTPVSSGGGGGDWWANQSSPWFLTEAFVVWSDPLAQSFLVDSLLSPRGVFITSISVYFKTVDQSTPVILELRNMTNGLPGSAILPGGRIILPGYAAGQSDNATVATTFTFDQPVYLQAGKEYCFVLKSTSLGYNAWCSRLGGTDVTSGKIIDTQPYLGTLFKSENDSTWIPDSYEDLKFDLNVAVFDISKTGNIVFRPMLESNNNYADLGQVLPLSYISTIAGSKSVYIKIPSHGLTKKVSLQKGDIIYITGLATTQNGSSLYFNGIPAANLVGEFKVDAILDEDTVSITSGSERPEQPLGDNSIATISGPIVVGDVFGSVSVTPSPLPIPTAINIAEHVVNTDNKSPSTVPLVPTINVENCIGRSGEKIISNNVKVFDPRYILIGSPISGSNVALNAKVTSINTDSNTIVVDLPHTGNIDNATLTFVVTAPPVRPAPPTVTSSNTFTVFVNALVNEGMIDYLGTEVEGTNIDEYVAVAQGFSQDGGTGTEIIPYTYVVPEIIDKDGRFHEFAEPRLIANPRNEILHSSELTIGNEIKKSLEINLELTSADKNVSPIIDTNGMTFTIRSYKIDNQNNQINDIFSNSNYNTASLLKQALNDFNQNSEIVPGQGLANAKYKGPIIQTTSDYKSIDLYITGNCPSPAIFDVYIRTSADADTHMDQNWEWMPYKGDYSFNHQENFPHSINKSIMNEWLFEYTSNTYFNVYDIKVVMRTTNNSVVPKIFGLRTIAQNV